MRPRQDKKFKKIWDVKVLDQTERHCLANILNFAFQFQKHFLLVASRNVYQACVCIMAKPTNMVIDKQNCRCLPDYVCLFSTSGGLRCDPPGYDNHPPACCLRINAM